MLTQLADRLELVAVVDPHAERAQQIVDDHGGRRTRVWPRHSPGPTSTSWWSAPRPVRTVELAIEALQADKDVIIEKPAEITVERTDEIIAAQQAAGRLVTVISQHRFDPATEVTVDAIAAGELGRLTSGIASIDWWRGRATTTRVTGAAPGSSTVAAR